MTPRASILIGYSCAIFAAALFGSVSSISKPVLTTLNPVLLSSLVYIISGVTFTPIAQKADIEKDSKKYYYLVLVTAIIGATTAELTERAFQTAVSTNSTDNNGR